MAQYLNSSSIPILYQQEIKIYLYDYLIYGGYPQVVLTNDINEKKDILKELMTSYTQKDIEESKLAHPENYLKIMKLLVGRTSCLLNINSLAKDLSLDHKTVAKYLWVIRKSFHFYLINPFYRNISSELKKMPKIYFADLGMHNCLLNDFSPIGLREDKGQLFENYIYLLLREKHGTDNIYFWRTQDGQEVDFIISLDDGTFKALKVKMNIKKFEKKRYAGFIKKYPEIPLSGVDIAKSFLPF